MFLTCGSGDFCLNVLSDKSSQHLNLGYLQCWSTMFVNWGGGEPSIKGLSMSM